MTLLFLLYTVSQKDPDSVQLWLHCAAANLGISFWWRNENTFEITISMHSIGSNRSDASRPWVSEFRPVIIIIIIIYVRNVGRPQSCSDQNPRLLCRMSRTPTDERPHREAMTALNLDLFETPRTAETALQTERCCLLITSIKLPLRNPQLCIKATKALVA